jgi:hypothetical protein
MGHFTYTLLLAAALSAAVALIDPKSLLPHLSRGLCFQRLSAGHLRHWLVDVSDQPVNIRPLLSER